MRLGGDPEGMALTATRGKAAGLRGPACSRQAPPCLHVLERREKWLREL